MTQISAQAVKDLREMTGAGMMECKKALTESNGDVEAAVKYLREKGLAAAAKKAGRIAAEGLVGIWANQNVAAMVEVNCETDFVARNPEFKELSDNLAEQVGLTSDLPANTSSEPTALLQKPFIKDTARTVETVVNDKVGTIGEKISVRRFIRFTDSDAYGIYSHGGGNLGVIVAMRLSDRSKASSEAVKILAKDIAMHVAAASPLYLKRADARPEAIEAERAIYKQQALEQGKPANIADRIVDGKIEKYYADTCLTEQVFVKDPDLTIQKLLDKNQKELGCTIELTHFARFKVGEGIEKKADDFAGEVAKMTGQN